MEKELKKKVAVSVAAGITSASVMLGSTFDNPSEIINDQPVKDKAIIETIDDDTEQDARKESGLKQKVRELIYKVPVRIRVFFCIPLWFLGNLIISLSDLFFQNLIMPIGQVVLNFCLHFLLVLLVAGICIKILFPDLPWSKIFNKRNILIAFIGSVVLSLCDLIMPHFFENYRLYRNISKFVLGLITIFIILRPFIRKKLKQRFSYEVRYENETFQL